MIDKIISEKNYSVFLIISLFFSIALVHVFYLAVINPISFEILAFAQDNNLPPPRHFAVVLKDPEQEICVILFVWSLLIGTFKFYLVNNEHQLIDSGGYFKDGHNSLNEDSPQAYQFLDAFIENKFDTQQQDLSFLKYISWAIPSIGFIGTVRGIGEALSRSAEAISGDISKMTESLGIAFNSTFVALLISIVLMLFITRLEHHQDEVIIKLRSKYLFK